MRFFIRRASQHYGEESPCVEAIAETTITRGGKPQTKYSVEIADLAALIAFSDKYGELIFDEKTICIYDDYVE